MVEPSNIPNPVAPPPHSTISPQSTKPDNQQPNKIGSAFELLTPSSKLVQKYLTLFIIVNIPNFAFSVVSSVSKLVPAPDKYSTFFSNNTPNNEIYTALGIIGVLLFTGIVAYAMNLVLELRAAKQEAVTFGSLLNEGLARIFGIIGIGILMAFIIIGGLLLLIVPGVIAIVRLIYAPYILINENVGPVEAIRRSWALSKKYSSASWGVVGVMLLVGAMTSAVSIVPVAGAIVGGIIGILFSLVLPLRYLELMKLENAGGPSVPMPPKPILG